MNQNEHDDLWELLGRARPRKASPMFARNVLRDVRQLEPAQEHGFLDWLRVGWNWLAVSTAAAALLFLSIGLRTPGPAPQPATVASVDNTVLEEVLQSPDLSVIANLDMLVAMDDNDLWLESSSR